jgi:hypothetical protein
MSRESEVAAYLRLDATLMAILTGGIYEYMEIMPEGIRRGADSPTLSAFDANGYLKPCALVKEASLVPYGNLYDEVEKITSTSQRVEIFFYQDRGYSAIQTAKERTYQLLTAYRFARAYPARNVLDSQPMADMGPLAGNSTIKQDWQIIGLRGAP